MVCSTQRDVSKFIICVDQIKSSNEVSQAIVGIILNIDATIAAPNTVVEAESDHGGQGACDCTSALADDFVKLSRGQSRAA